MFSALFLTKEPKKAELDKPLKREIWEILGCWPITVTIIFPVHAVFGSWKSRKIYFLATLGWKREKVLNSPHSEVNSQASHMHYVMAGMRKTSHNKKKMSLVVENKILLVCNSKYLLGQEQELRYHRRGKGFKTSVFV